jgi:hypothetical protein
MPSRIGSSGLGALALLAALVAPAPARAEPTATERAMADSLFRDAKKLLARGKTPEACEKLDASYRLDPAGGTLINLAMCHEIEGKTGTAWSEFNVALAAARKAARADREKAAREHMHALEPRLSHLTLSVPQGSEAPGLEIKLDGTAVESKVLGTAISVDPGDHTASAGAPGREPWQAKISLHEGENQTLTVPLLASTAPPPPPAPPPPTPWKRPVGIAAAGAGAALLAVGAGFGARAISLGGTAASDCPNLRCSPAGLSAVSDGRSAAGIANGTLAAGGLLMATGVVFLILSFVTAPEPKAGLRLPSGGSF